MKNFIQPGNALELTAPGGGVLSGVGYAFGPAAQKMVVVADHDADAAAKATFNSEGVFEFTKDGADDFVEGEPCFWDDSAKKVDKSASTLVPMGTSVETTAGSAVLIKVKLSGQQETVVT
jgi:predicted RecA/RadA family phage recombinase